MGRGTFDKASLSFDKLPAYVKDEILFILPLFGRKHHKSPTKRLIAAGNLYIFVTTKQI